MEGFGLCTLLYFTVFAVGITSSGEVFDRRGSWKQQNFLLICEVR